VTQLQNVLDDSAGIDISVWQTLSLCDARVPHFYVARAEELASRTRHRCPDPRSLVRGSVLADSSDPSSPLLQAGRGDVEAVKLEFPHTSAAPQELAPVALFKNPDASAPKRALEFEISPICIVYIVRTSGA
jgi:hypothetical protein